jgi:hypothetical protein
MRAPNILTEAPELPQQRVALRLSEPGARRRSVQHGVQHGVQHVAWQTHRHTPLDAAGLTIEDLTRMRNETLGLWESLGLTRNYLRRKRDAVD